MYSIRSLLQTLAIGAICVTASGCAYIIPPDPNAPRNNTVLGDVRKPEMNPGASRNMRSLQASQPVTAGAAYPTVTAPAPQQIAVAAPVVESGMPRQVPLENQTMQLAASNYPSLDSVPQRPPVQGPDSSAARLDAAKTDLEQGRAAAQQSKSSLLNDAKNEPSMLSDLPKTDGVVPPADPVRVTPTVTEPKAVEPSPGASVQPSVSPYAAAQPTPIVPAAAVGSTLPASPSFAPPAPLAGASSTPSVTAQAALPVASPSKPVGTTVASQPQMEVNLPVAKAAAPSVVSGETMTVARINSGITVRDGDFDPLAAADMTSAEAAPVVQHTMTPASGSYANRSYMAPSRYYDQR